MGKTSCVYCKPKSEQCKNCPVFLDEQENLKSIEMELKDLNIKEIESYVTGMMGISICFIREIELIKNETEHLHLKSPELIIHSGIFSQILKSVKITTFSSFKFSTNRKKVHGTLCIQYITKNGGLNYINFLSCLYNIETGKWDFKPAI